MQVLKVFYYCLVCLICFSCGNNKTWKHESVIKFDRKDFITQRLKGDSLKFDAEIMKPYHLMIYDSILITANRGTDKIFHLFNLNTGKKIGERITMGQGAGEMINPYFINVKNFVGIYDMMNSNVFYYDIAGFVNGSCLFPVRSYKLNEVNMFTELGVFGDSLVGISYRPDYPCYVFDSEGKKQKNGIGTYPLEDYTDLEKIDAFRAILTTNGSDRIAICHFFTDLIEIYSSMGDLVKRISGPDHFRTRFIEYQKGDQIGSMPDNHYYRDAFYSPVAMKDGFAVLYNGKFVTEPEYNLLAEDIFVFDWNGNPKKHYKLDQGVSRIAVDANQRKIYGISDIPEYHIVVFSY